MKRLYVYDTPGRYVLMRGTNLGDWLRENRIPAVYARPLRGFRLHRDRYADTVAMAEESGVLVTVRGGGVL